MNLKYIFWRELSHSCGAFTLGMLAIAVAVACIIAARAFLAAHDHRTEKLVGALEQRSSERMAELRDEARKFSLNLGFNTMILPPGQDIAEFHANDRNSSFFSEEDVAKLANAKLGSLNHLRPIIREPVKWQEMNREIILVGVRGEIYIKAPKWQKPISKAIAPDVAHLGYALANSLEIRKGDSITFNGRRFTVEEILPQSAGKDDISIRVNLETAQDMLGYQGKIGAILAITCNCADADPGLPLREVDGLIEGTQVLNFSLRANARRKARSAIGKGTREQIADIQESRAAMREQFAVFAKILIVAVSAGAIALLALLTFNNARERKAEVAMLRALGVKRTGILLLFIGKAFFAGIVGYLAGVAAGLMIARLIAGRTVAVSPRFAGALCVVTIVIAILSSLLPAFQAASQDPAKILKQE